MDQETAQKLLVEGGTLVLLGVPPATAFGVDLQCWSTAEDFRGVKMLPPGLHYVHYAPVCPSTGDAGPRSGFLHYFHKKEFLVKLWDARAEQLSAEQVSDESVQRLRDNLLALDRHLAPYPYDVWHKWKLLTSQITAELATKLSPEKGIIRASVDLLPMTDEDRPRGVKSEATASLDSEPTGTEATEQSTTSKLTPNKEEPGQSDAKRARRLTRAERENAMLPDLKPVPGLAMRFTPIPQDKFPAGASPAEVTKHYLDQSYSLDLMIAQHTEPLHIIGELQLAYLCFLIGHSLESFEHWKSLVVLLCSCDDAIHKYRSVFFHFIRTLELQLAEMPAEFLADIVMDKNIVYKKLREFIRTAHVSKAPVGSRQADARLRAAAARLRDRAAAALRWDLSGLDEDEDEDEDDERPVVVRLDDHQ